MFGFLLDGIVRSFDKRVCFFYLFDVRFELADVLFGVRFGFDVFAVQFDWQSTSLVMFGIMFDTCVVFELCSEERWLAALAG